MEHARIVGVEHGVVAVTKGDLIALELAIGEAAKFLLTAWNGGCSARTGDDLWGALERLEGSKQPKTVAPSAARTSLRRRACNAPLGRVLEITPPILRRKSDTPLRAQLPTL
jgi:hypothetical protein